MFNPDPAEHQQVADDLYDDLQAAHSAPAGTASAPAGAEAFTLPPEVVAALLGLGKSGFDLLVKWVLKKASG